MVDWVYINGYGSDDDSLSYENEISGCVIGACESGTADRRTPTVKTTNTLNTLNERKRKP